MNGKLVKCRCEAPQKETITVIIGWNEGIGAIVLEVDQAVGPESKAWA